MTAAAPTPAPAPAAPPRRGLLRRWLDGLTSALNLCGSALILAIMVLICADIIGRSAFEAPISGVPEMVTLSIVAIVFLQAPQAVRMSRLTRSDAFPDFLAARAPRIAGLLEALYDLLGLLIMGAVLQASWPLFLKAWKRDTFVGAVGDFMAPVWPVKLIILIGCAMLMLRFGLRIADAAFGRPADGGHEEPRP